MTRTYPQMETIDDLIALHVRRQTAGIPDTASRFRLSEYSREQWCDPEAGAAWEKQRDALNETHSQLWSLPDDNPVAAAAAAQQAALRARKPAQRTVTTWTLNSGRFRTDYVLSPQLGERLDAIWTRRGKYGNYRTGSMTLGAMLKKLGAINATVKQEIATKRQAAQAEQAARMRTAARRRVLIAIEALAEAMTESADAIGAPMPLRTAPEIARALGVEVVLEEKAA